MKSRWQFALGLAGAVAVGAALGAGTVAGVGAVRAEHSDGPYDRTDPGAARWACDGAQVLAVAVLDDGLVEVRVLIDDPRGRRWLVGQDHPDVADPVRAGRTPDGDYVPVAIVTGDLDDGPTRAVLVRTHDGRAECFGAVSLT